MVTCTITPFRAAVRLNSGVRPQAGPEEFALQSRWEPLARTTRLAKGGIRPKKALRRIGICIVRRSILRRPIHFREWTTAGAGVTAKARPNEILVVEQRCCDCIQLGLLHEEDAYRGEGDY